MQVCQAAQGEFAFELTMAVAASEMIMRRRHFLTFAIGAFLSASAQAQQAGGLRRVGVLFPGVFGEEREKRLNEGLASELGTERVTVIIKSAAGGLISYGPNNFDLMKQAGDMVGKVLRGQKAAELPIQRPIYVRFLISLRTAKYFNLTVPASLSALADEVIE